MGVRVDVRVSGWVCVAVWLDVAVKTVILVGASLMICVDEASVSTGKVVGPAPICSVVARLELPRSVVALTSVCWGLPGKLHPAKNTTTKKMLHIRLFMMIEYKFHRWPRT